MKGGEKAMYTKSKKLLATICMGAMVLTSVPAVAMATTSCNCGSIIGGDDAGVDYSKWNNEHNIHINQSFATMIVPILYLRL